MGSLKRAATSASVLLGVAMSAAVAAPVAKPAKPTKPTKPTKPAQAEQPKPVRPPPRTPALLAAGKAVYERHAAGCAACHGPTGRGDGPVAFAIKPPPRNLVEDPFKNGDSVERIYDTVTHGLPNTRMVGYPNIPDADRWALAYYVAGLRKPRR